MKEKKAVEKTEVKPYVDETTGIKLWKMPVKFNNYLLDAYALKKHGKLYEYVKSEVNEDIRAMSEKHKTHKVSDMKFFIISELLPNKTKKEIMAKYWQ